MTLKEHIEDIAKSLEQDMFPNETEVCDKIVHRILDILNWPRYDHGIRLREYDLRGLRVDFALCHPASEPQVFIEVKRIGNIDGAEDQLFGYASRENVPIAVLTDGRKWQFFYPSGLGNYDKRKVDELDMKEGDSEENAELFNRYLGYEAIRTGEAAGAIQGKYEDLSKQRQIEKHLPDAWKNLVESGDEFLIELVAEATKELCGHRPDDEQVLAYLKREELPRVQPNRPETHADQPEQPDTSKPRKNRPSTRLRVMMSDGEVIERPHAKATFIEMIEKFGLEKVMSIHPTTVLTEPPKYFWVPHGQFYIHYYADTHAKKRVLEEIAQLLSIQLAVEIVEKQ